MLTYKAVALRPDQLEKLALFGERNGNEVIRNAIDQHLEEIGELTPKAVEDYKRENLGRGRKRKEKGNEAV